MKNKKGQSIGGIVAGVIGLVILITIGFVTLGILSDSGLLTTGSAGAGAVSNLTSNLTSGVANVAVKIPTIFTIAVAVLLLGLIVYLVQRARQASTAQGGSI